MSKRKRNVGDSEIDDPSIEKVVKKRKVYDTRSVLEKEETFCVELVSGETEKKLGTFEISSTTNPIQLNQLVNEMHKDDDLPENQIFSFHINALEVLQNIRKTILERSNETRKATSTKDAPIKIIYYKQTLYKVRPITRCSDTLHGHSESILCLQFSTDGQKLVSGSGDTTLRLWDLTTATPIRTMKGHTSHVLVAAWSGDSRVIASGDRGGSVRLWDGNTGKSIGVKKNIKKSGHKKWVTSIDWEPFHLNVKCTRFVSSSKDGTLKIWNSKLSLCTFTLSGHSKGITCVKWSGNGDIFSGSQDSKIMVWHEDPKTSKFICKKTLTGHSHWINSMSMSTDYTLRRGPFDEHCDELDFSNLQKYQKNALERYRNVLQTPLKIVTCSDDNTLCLWEPSKSTKPLKRMMGHLGIINDVKFSPNGKFIASASFDKSIIIWDARGGNIVCKLRGHVGAVYKLAWSGDSRLLVSASKDSTCKVWNVPFKKLEYDLPGHFDEVFTVDWSPDGQRISSGGKDRTLKIWKH